MCATLVAAAGKRQRYCRNVIIILCVRFEPYHIRAVAEELAAERGGKKPAGSEKHMMWGEVFHQRENNIYINCITWNTMVTNEMSSSSTILRHCAGPNLT